MKLEQTECSETSAYEIQKSGNHPKVIIQLSEHGESLKSRINGMSSWFAANLRIMSYHEIRMYIFVYNQYAIKI